MKVLYRNVVLDHFNPKFHAELADEVHWVARWIFDESQKCDGGIRDLNRQQKVVVN